MGWKWRVILYAATSVPHADRGQPRPGKGQNSRWTTRTFSRRSRRNCYSHCSTLSESIISIILNRMSQADAWRTRAWSARWSNPRARSQARENGRFYRWQVYERDDRLGRFVDQMDRWIERSADAYPIGVGAGTVASAAYQWSRDTFDRGGRSGIAAAGYNPGTYNAADVPWRGDGGWARHPKGWDQPDQPWPVNTAGEGAGGGGGGKKHFNSKARVERY